MNTIVQRVALYLALGLVLHTLSVDVFAWQFWAIIALFWSSEYMVRKGTEETAKIEGISRYLELSSDEQAKIRKLHQEWKKLDER